MIPWLADVVASLTALLAQASVDTATWTLAELRSKGRNSFDRLHDHSQLPAEISRHRCVFYACLLREAVSLLSSSPPTPNASHLSPRAISDHSSCYALIDESFSLLPQDASPALRDSARLLSAVALIDLAALFGPHGASTSSGGRSAGGHMGGYIDKGAADALACAAAACAERIPHAHTLALTAPVRSSMRASDSASQVDSGVALGVGGVGDDDDGNGSDEDDDDDDVSKCADGNRPHDRCNASVQTLQWLTRPVATVRAVRSVTATSAASQLLSVSAADDTAANSQPVPVVLRAAADAWGWTAHTRWPSIGLAETQTRTQTSPATTADAAQATAVDASPPMSCLVSVLLARVWPLEPAWVPYTRAHWRPTLARGAALWRGLSSHSGQCPRRAREGCGPAGSEAGRCSECEHAGLYLAQHPVLARVPQLRGDAPAPDCCALPPPSHSSSRRVSATSDATAVQSPSVGARPMLVLPASVSAAALGAEAAMRPRLALPAPKNAAARLALPTASATVRALSMHIPHAGEAALTCSVTPTVEPTVKRARIAVAGPDLSTTTSDAATEDSLAAEDEDTMVVSNCWIGPVGTVSPLHTVRNKTSSSTHIGNHACFLWEYNMYMYSTNLNSK